MTRAIIDEKNWIRCGECRHKLGKIVADCEFSPMIEIKCHSCKELNIFSKGVKEDKEDDR